MKIALREAVNMCELRTMPQGHPDYRFICPALTDAGNIIDWEKYRLGWLQSEMRTEFKKSACEKKE